MPSHQAKLLELFFRLRRLARPRLETRDVAKARRQMRTAVKWFVSPAGLDCRPADVGGVPVEWVSFGPAGEQVVLWLHGGAYYVGSIASHRALAGTVAKASGARVLLVDYRLAPENPFPAAPDDVRQVYQWLLANGVTANQLVLAGDSAGGGLALAVVRDLLDRELPPPAGVVCLSPWTDLTCSGTSHSSNARSDLMLETQGLRLAADLYLNGSDPRHPLASPLFADLSGFPPLLIQVGGGEILLSDAVTLASRASAAGVDVNLQIWPGMQHEWQLASSILPEGQQAIDQIGAYIRDIGNGT